MIVVVDKIVDEVNKFIRVLFYEVGFEGVRYGVKSIVNGVDDFDIFFGKRLVLSFGSGSLEVFD